MTQETSTQAIPWQRRMLYGITNWALLAAGLANLAVGTWSAFNASAAIAATSLTAGLVLLFAATIDRFESLKGLGIEAKTKQLDSKIVQADEALRRLREMTEITGAALVDLNSKMGRFDSAPGLRESLALADRVRSIMTALGSQPSTIHAALYPWARVLCFDMAQVHANRLDVIVRERVQALEAEQQRVPQPLKPDDPIFTGLSARIASLLEYQTSRLRNLHRLTLDDYPDKFIRLFDEIPQVETFRIAPLRDRATQFASGMRSLRDARTLPDPELWITELDRARDE